MTGEELLKPSSDQNTTKAAELNRRVLRKLEKAFDSNPEVDLLSKMPSSYATRLANCKKTDVEDISTLRCDLLSRGFFLKSEVC